MLATFSCDDLDVLMIFVSNVGVFFFSTTSMSDEHVMVGTIDLLSLYHPNPRMFGIICMKAMFPDAALRQNLVMMPRKNEAKYGVIVDKDKAALFKSKLNRFVKVFKLNFHQEVSPKSVFLFRCGVQTLPCGSRICVADGLLSYKPTLSGPPYLTQIGMIGGNNCETT